jgi:hypothetical protein
MIKSIFQALANSITLNNDCRLCASSAALHPLNIGRSADFERMRATVPLWLQLRDRCLGLTAERAVVSPGKRSESIYATPA